MVDINSLGFIIAMLCLCLTLFVRACAKTNEERAGLGLEPQYNPETLNKCYKAIFYTLIVALATMCINGIALIWQN